jgi:hypothetical protein
MKGRNPESEQNASFSRSFLFIQKDKKIRGRAPTLVGKYKSTSLLGIMKLLCVTSYHKGYLSILVISNQKIMSDQNNLYLTQPPF